MIQIWNTFEIYVSTFQRHLKSKDINKSFYRLNFFETRSQLYILKILKIELSDTNTLNLAIVQLGNLRHSKDCRTLKKNNWFYVAITMVFEYIFYKIGTQEKYSFSKITWNWQKIRGNSKKPLYKLSLVRNLSYGWKILLRILSNGGKIKFLCCVFYHLLCCVFVAYFPCCVIFIDPFGINL